MKQANSECEFLQKRRSIYVFFECALSLSLLDGQLKS